MVANNQKGLSDFPTDLWPDRIEFLYYYSYHIMDGLGTIFITVMGLAALQLWRRKLFTSRWILWPLMLSVPLPYTQAARYGLTVGLIWWILGVILAAGCLSIVCGKSCPGKACGQLTYLRRSAALELGARLLGESDTVVLQAD
jgi:Cytochrome bd terminal oxidase subunit I